MQTYTLPRRCFDLLVEAVGDEKKAGNFAKAIEPAIGAINDNAARTFVEKMGAFTLPQEALDSLLEVFGDRRKEIAEKKEFIKIEIKEELKKELLTREIFEERFKVIEERFNVVDEKIKSLEKVMNEKLNSLNFKLNIFVAIALIALTFANPAFVQLLGKLF